jgi:cystathionine gamma-synthase
MHNQQNPATIGIHGRTEEKYLPATYPIFQTSTFGFHTSEEMPAAFRGEVPDANIYTRLTNPTVRNVEERLAPLEHAEQALLFASGMSAITAVLMGYLRQGDLLVSSRPVYGGTHQLIANMLGRWGIRTRFLLEEELYDLETHAPDATVVFIETPANPTCMVLSLPQIVESAQKVGAVTVVDNTFASPINQNPLDLGIDIVVHSATKYLGGHSDVISGAVMTSAERMEPIAENRLIFGGSSSPLEAFLMDRSLKTLHMRVQQHNQNAQHIAEFFADAMKIKHVYYPGLPGTADHEKAKQQMHGFGGMVALEMESAEAAITFVDSLKLGFNAVSLGGVETLVTIPALSTHSKVEPEALAIARVTPATVRISVGLEHVDDLIGDFKQALMKI